MQDWATMKHALILTYWLRNISGHGLSITAAK